MSEPTYDPATQHVDEHGNVVDNASGAVVTPADPPTAPPLVSDTAPPADATPSTPSDPTAEPGPSASQSAQVDPAAPAGGDTGAAQAQTTAADSAAPSSPVLPPAPAVAAPGAPAPLPPDATLAPPPPPTGSQFGGTSADQAIAAATESAAKDPGFVSSKPLLTTGAFGADVDELAHLLLAAGHPNAVAAGLSEPVLSDELMRLVKVFQEANGIDPSKPQTGVDGTGPASAPLIPSAHEGIVEAMTWAALYDAAGEEVGEALEVSARRYPQGSFA